MTIDEINIAISFFALGVSVSNFIHTVFAIPRNLKDE